MCLLNMGQFTEKVDMERIWTQIVVVSRIPDHDSGPKQAEMFVKNGPFPGLFFFIFTFI